jgi:1,4-alpha-glucan branching enzyme
MSKHQVISIVLNAHLPLAREPEQDRSPEEQWFFEALSETYLPLLAAFDRLDADRIPFRLAISLSPTLCFMLRDELLLNRYLAYVDRQIDFGSRELERTAPSQQMNRLARLYYERAVEKRILFTERYGGDVLGIFDYYQKKGRLELLTTAATYAYLPIYAAYPEAIQAQLEVADAAHRSCFGKNPQGFLLPEFGWSAELDEYLRAYNFSYTLVDTHGAILGNPEASRGSFYPLRTPAHISILVRDYYAQQDLWGSGAAYRSSPEFRDYHRDVGYELPAAALKSFLEPNGARIPTGYKYWTSGGQKSIYDPQRASERTLDHVRSFLDARTARLSAAGEYMAESPISLCAYNADDFGRFWYEGPEFIETLFREGASRGEIQFMTPAEYLSKQNAASFQAAVPEFSSSGPNGYAEMWLDASNDWLYPHLVQAMDRMIELAERFPNDSGLKERSLNQAAREILLAQSSDWAKMLYNQENTEYARSQIEGALRNFTTIYESLGSNYISTEWLTNLERRHNIFPTINYRVFRRKK